MNNSINSNELLITVLRVQMATVCFASLYYAYFNF